MSGIVKERRQIVARVRECTIDRHHNLYPGQGGVTIAMQNRSIEGRAACHKPHQQFMQHSPPEEG